MDRRRLLQLLTFGGGSVAIGAGLYTFRAAVASEDGAKWGYVGNSAPEHWGDLSADYKACKTGIQQSPIDLHSAVDADLATIEINYQPIPLSILNNGHTIQVDAAKGNTIRLDGEEFELLQFHFHHPSEHTVERNPYPMELHLVHANAQGELAVLGVFMQEGEENLALNPVWQAMPPRKTKSQKVPGAKVDLAQLLPKEREMYRYFGSLTTPPCSEIVKWVVYQTPIQVSSAQVAQFKNIFPLNARPTQVVRRRFILE